MSAGDGGRVPAFFQTVKVKATEPYYIRATFQPLRHFNIFLVRDTIVYIG